MPTYDEITDVIYMSSRNILEGILDNSIVVDGITFIIHLFEISSIMIHYQHNQIGKVNIIALSKLSQLANLRLILLRDIRNNLSHSLYDIRGEAYKIKSSKLLKIVLDVLDHINLEVNKERYTNIQNYINNYIEILNNIKISINKNTGNTTSDVFNSVNF